MEASLAPRPAPVVFLHTATVHVETFDRLVAEARPGLRVEHVVAEHLLAEAQRDGPADPVLVERVHAAMQAAARGGARVVACTCSTIGDAAERTPTDGRFQPIRIDRAMADRAVALGARIRVLAALESTVQPTLDLIQASASRVDRSPDVQVTLVSGAWSHFMRGDREGYLQAIALAARSVPAADVIVLAQASMAPAAERLRDLGIAVLASPRIGVQDILARIDDVDRQSGQP